MGLSRIATFEPFVQAAFKVLHRCLLPNEPTPVGVYHENRLQEVIQEHDVVPAAVKNRNAAWIS